MKIKVVDKSFEEVSAIPAQARKLPKAQSPLFRWLIGKLSDAALKPLHFQYEKKHMDRINEKEPCLYLMNHSCFTDLEIAAKIIGNKPYHIVCTSDGFVGKEGLMKKIGCIPTQKFVTDLKLVKNLVYVIYQLQASILMFPEASYSFDGTATPLPEGLGKCVKMLATPVVMIRTHGAFLHDPLYNGLQTRAVDVTAVEECILTADDIQRMSVEEINKVLKENFTFDYFQEQKEKEIRISEPFRADGLERVLYKCPCCGEEGKTKGKGTFLHCSACGQEFYMNEYGSLEKTWVHPDIDEDLLEETFKKEDFSHIPSWYRWERTMVRQEVEDLDYQIEVPVNIMMLVDTKAIYRVGEGVLTHSRQGFHLTGCDGKLDYSQKPKASYSLYADYFWYELGDMVCIGNKNVLYYCFPKDQTFPVAKLRLATEELYNLCNAGKKSGRTGEVENA